jgi:CRISPR-associated endonuclease Csn1
METLGLDLGSNSIGWAICDDEEKRICNCGVYRFAEGVKIEKGNESSLASERTSFRAARKLKQRRKIRKYNTLKILIQNNMCPLTMEELNLWGRYTKGTVQKYPASKDFIKWLMTEDSSPKEKQNIIHYNPYVLRKKAVHERLSLYELGRVFYHLAQRRGFKSNRKDAASDSDGKVAASINDLSKELNGRTLGEFFCDEIEAGHSVRGRYTSRDEHYIVEFRKICEVQHLSEKLSEELYKAIFYQRPLKSKKYLVGKCTLEKNKDRAPVSHYLFEEFRALTLLNNIRIGKKGEDEKANLQPLNDEQFDILYTYLLTRKTDFTYTELVKKLFGKAWDSYELNYPLDISIPVCSVSAGFNDVFGDDWRNIQIGTYNIDKIWHNLFFFDDIQKLKMFAIDKLHLSEEKAVAFTKIPVKQGYASYSLKAIKAILPFLRKPYKCQLAQAVFLAKIPEIIGTDNWVKHSKEIIETVTTICKNRDSDVLAVQIANAALPRLWGRPQARLRDHLEAEDRSLFEEKAAAIIGVSKWSNKAGSERNKIIQTVEKMITDGKYLDAKWGELISSPRSADKISEYLLSFSSGLTAEEIRSKLYHPAENEWYSHAEFINNEKFLPSPEIPALNNPLVLRTMHSLKKLVNSLIKDKQIDENTKITIELAGELNDKNKRLALQKYQSEREKENLKYKEELSSYINGEPSEDDIKKFRLYEEQQHSCIYTGNEITPRKIFTDQTFDIEHTIPRSFSFDNSLENLTLCDAHYNRDVKKNMIPSQLADYDVILERAERCYKTVADEWFTKVRVAGNKAKASQDKETKDSALQWKYYCLLNAQYYASKYRRFTMHDVTAGFVNRQLVDTRIITKYVKYYLKTVFPSIFTVNGSLTADFRKLWGLQDAYKKKDRSNHTHHAIDAITLACMTRKERDLLAMATRSVRSKTKITQEFKQPWNNFTNDVLKATNNILVVSSSKDKLFNASRHSVFKNSNKYVSGGSVVRGSLHQDTVYGAIKQKGKDGKEKLVYVVRRPVTGGDPKDGLKIENIVDPAIRSEAQKIGRTSLKSGTPLYLTTKKGTKVQVKTIRCIATDVGGSAIKIKQQNFVSTKGYKQYKYVKTDFNYGMAIYEYKDTKGKYESDFVIRNAIDAVKAHQNKEDIFPKTTEKRGNIYTQKYILKTGTTVLLLQDHDEDIRSLPNSELLLRMYTITGLSSMVISQKYLYGTIKLRWNQEARPASDLKAVNGLFVQTVPPIPVRLLLHTQFMALIGGIDFDLLPNGSIKWR